MQWDSEPNDQQLVSWLAGRTEQQAEEIIAMRRHLHAHPEASRDEFRTTAWLQDQFGIEDFLVRQCKDERGLVVDRECGSVADRVPRVALRADIDALRMDDLKDVPYKSTKPGLAHACGHDAHTTIVLTVARLFRELLDSSSNGNFPARLRFIFQPAEEVCEGAASLVQQGVMNEVGAILGLHVEPQLAAGKVGIRYGALTAYCDELLVTMQGTGGHAARPHHTTDPIAAAALMISSLYQLIPRVADARNPAVLTIGQLVGGTAPNVIPESVMFAGTLRTTDQKTRDLHREKILETCRQIASLTGNKIDARLGRSLGAVRNDGAVTRLVQDAVEETLGGNSVVLIDQPSMGGEDFAFYLDHAPGCQIRLGCAAAGSSGWPLLHSPVFDIDETSLIAGIRVLTLAMFRVAKQFAKDIDGE